MSALTWEDIIVRCKGKSKHNAQIIRSMKADNGSTTYLSQQNYVRYFTQ